MRVLSVAALALCLSACASERLAVNPPAGLNLTGKWRLNEADSDDPQHLLTPSAKSTPNPNDPAQNPPQRRRGGGPGGGGPNLPPGGGMMGPMAPNAGAMGATLRYPGKQVEIRQVAGVVSFSSEGRSRVCQPGSEHKKTPKADYRDRDPSPAAARETGPPVCGWEDASLVVLGPETDDGKSPYEEQYTLSENRARLIETIVFKGGRSNGYTLSRVWDRDDGSTPLDATPAAAAHGPPGPPPGTPPPPPGASPPQ